VSEEVDNSQNEGEGRSAKWREARRSLRQELKLPLDAL